jgi:RNase H-fold protein (predicted Holliday junction resolvase)
MATHRILGISIGTTKIGIAVLERNVVIEWKMKCFRETWSQAKLESIVAYIDHYTLVHPIKRIGIKIPAPHSHTCAITQVIQLLEHVAKTKGINTYVYTLTDVKRYWNGEHKTTRDQLIKAVLGKHPKFQKEYHRILKTKNFHYEKLFEAIAAADMAVKE